MTKNQQESLDRLRDEISTLNQRLLDITFERDKALESLKNANLELANLKNKLIDIAKILSSQ